MAEEKTKEIENIPVRIIDEGRSAGKQLSIRFPKRVSDALDIDPEKDEFLFKFNKVTLHLEGELINKGEFDNEKNN